MDAVNKLSIRPIGGVQEIGSNFTFITDGHSHFGIDFGILFPDDDLFGLDYLIPDLDEIPKLEHLVISHGHEDHIGAIIHIIDRFPGVKIYAPLFAAELIRSKLSYKKMSYPLEIFDHESTLSIGTFQVSPIHVNHSIPQTFGLFFRSSQVKDTGAFFISDFKVDPSNSFGDFFDFKRLKELSKDLKNRILLADSTNILSAKKHTPSEDDLYPGLLAEIENAPSRVFVTTFASNIHRMQTLVKIAKKTGRKLALRGRSLEKYSDIALNLGILKGLDEVQVPAESCGQDHKVIIITAGCQGDFRGALKRISIGQDPIFKLGPNDTIIFSSKTIPGNENSVNNILNSLSLKTDRIITASDALVHASGHPGKDDLLKTYNEYAPHHIIPIHGEIFFLRRHLKFIEQSFPQARGHYLINGDTFNIDESGSVSIQKGDELIPVLIQGGHPLERSALSERRKLAQQGTCFITLALRKIGSGNKLRGESYDFHLVGLPKTLSNTPFEGRFETFMVTALQSIKKEKNSERACEDLRVKARQFLGRLLNYRPVVYVSVLN